MNKKMMSICHQMEDEQVQNYIDTSFDNSDVLKMYNSEGNVFDDNLPEPYIDPLETNYEANSPSFHDFSQFNSQGYDLDIIEDFVRKAHYGQIRKYTNEPYHNHVFRVAEMVMEYTCDVHMYIAALMHDVLEDTEYKMKDIIDILKQSGFEDCDMDYVCHMIYDLTDVYTSQDYPNINRKNRKKLESSRLSKILPSSQTIKYCDLIDNTSSIVKYDKNFAKIYLKEKKHILEYMDKGDSTLYYLVNVLLNDKEQELNEYECK